MARRSRKSRITRRRVFLVVAALIVLALGTGAYLIRQHIHAKDQAARRVAGLQAFEDGDYQAVLDQLGPYLRDHDEDVTALYRYGLARLELPLEGGKHVREAITILRHVHSLDAEYEEVGSMLLQLYQLTEQHSEVVSLTEEMLVRSSEGEEALRHQAIALSRLERYDDALKALDAFTKLSPMDMQMHLLSLDVQRSAKHSGEQLVGYANALLDKHPEDPRFKVILAHAHRLAQDRDAAIRWLRAAAAQGLPEVEPTQQEAYATILAQWLDDAGLPSESLSYLNEVEQSEHSFLFQWEIVRRLWEDERWNEIVKRAADFDPAAKDVPFDLLALIADGLFRADEDDRAQEFVDALERHHVKAGATLWADWLRVRHVAAKVDAKKLVDLCSDALNARPRHAYWLDLQGRAYAAVGESHLALDAWERATSARPSWAGPHVRAARLEAQMGRQSEALKSVRSAARLQPKRLDIAVLLTLLWSANLKPADEEGAKGVLQLIDRIQKEFPDEERVLAVQVAMLAQLKKTDGAKRVISDVLGRKDKIQPKTMRQLAAVSRQLDLGQVDELLQAADAGADSGESGVAKAVADAVRIHREQSESEALAHFDRARSNAPSELAVAWAVARAQLLDHMKGEAASAQWGRVLEMQPGDVGIVRLALRSEAVRSDSELSRRLIRQLRELTSESGLDWRVERARWLMREPDEESRWNKAAVLLQEVIHAAPDHLEARLMRARCLDALGLRSAAVEELQAVLNQRPDAAAIALEAARLRLRDGDRSAATVFLDQALSSDRLEPERLTLAASMLADLGRTKDAIATLERLPEDATLSPEAELLSARLHAAAGDHDKVEAIRPSLLRSPTPSAIQFLATYYAERDQREEARAVLSKLESLELLPGQRDAIIGAHVARYDGSAAAVKHYRQAVGRIPTRVGLQHGLIVALLSEGQIDDAIQQAIEARKSIDSDDAIAILADNADLLRRVGRLSLLVPVMAAMVTDAPNRETALEILKDLDKAQRSNEASITTLRRLRQRLDQAPRFLALSHLVTRLMLRANQTEEAISVSLRAVNAYPDRIEPVTLAAQSLLRGKRYDEIVPLIDRWRQQSFRSHHALEATAAIAEIQLGKPAAAQTRLEQYIEQARKDPDEYATVLAQYAQSLILQGRSGQAVALVGPLLAKSTSLRQQWVELAASGWKDHSFTRSQLDALIVATPASAVADRIRLVRVWTTYAQRTKDESALQSAKTLLRDVLAQPQPPAEASLLMGIFAEQDKDNEQAESHYKSALAADPAFHPAMNNLAYMLAAQGKDLPRALQLAEKATKARPNDANYFDTLAFVHERRGQHDQALAAIRNAIRLEPNNDRWRKRLLELSETVKP